MKIVREYSQVYTEYLVDTDDELDAYYRVDEQDCVEIDVMPVYAGLLKREVRDITDKDRRDPVFIQALDNLEYNSIIKPIESIDNPMSFLDELTELISD